MIASLVELSADDRLELERRARSRALRADDVKRARLMLMLNEGKTYREFPEHQSVFHHCTPEYAKLAGWAEDISKVITANDIPRQARDYIAFLEAECGVPISIVSVGPERDQTLRIAA